MKEITVQATVSNIERINSFVDDELDRIGCPRKTNFQINLCVDEIVTNIASYAYGSGSGDVTVSLDFDNEKRLLSISFVDRGIPFDPRSVPEPDITSPLEKRPIGGLGLFMVKNIMDSVGYRREGNHNVLTIRKRI